MSDEHFREIQLSGKQLVFLFMASVVIAVAVFLLGVSVGRGVRDADVSVSAEATPPPVATNAPGADEMPAPTATSSRDSAFEQLLAGRSGTDEAPPADSGAAPAVPPAYAPPEVNEPVEQTTAAPSADRPAAAARSSQPAPTPPRPAAPAAAPRSTPSGQWTVQVNAFRSRANADREAASLRAKGYDAYVDASASDGLFRVRVGAYPDRAEADRTAARLRQEGLRPSVTQ